MNPSPSIPWHFCALLLTMLLPAGFDLGRETFECVTWDADNCKMFFSGVSNCASSCDLGVSHSTFTSSTFHKNKTIFKFINIDWVFLPSFYFNVIHLFLLYSPRLGEPPSHHPNRWFWCKTSRFHLWHFLPIPQSRLVTHRPSSKTSRFAMIDPAFNGYACKRLKLNQYFVNLHTYFRLLY